MITISYEAPSIKRNPFTAKNQTQKTIRPFLKLEAIEFFVHSELGKATVTHVLDLVKPVKSDSFSS